MRYLIGLTAVFLLSVSANASQFGPLPPPAVACLGPAALHNPHCRIWHHPKPPKPPTSPSDPKGPGNASSAWCTGGCVWVGGFIAAVATAIVIHEILGPKCAKPGLKNGYDSPTFWRPLCENTNVVSVRG